MRIHITTALGAASLVALAYLSAPRQAIGGSYADVDSKRLRAADSAQNAGQWLSYGRDYSEQRYSPLKQVTVDNVSQLGLAWYGDLSERGGSYETTPVVSRRPHFRDVAMEQGLRLRCQDRQAAVEVRPARAR